MSAQQSDGGASSESVTVHICASSTRDVSLSSPSLPPVSCPDAHHEHGDDKWGYEVSLSSSASSPVSTPSSHNPLALPAHHHVPSPSHIQHDPSSDTPPSSSRSQPATLTHSPSNLALPPPHPSSSSLPSSARTSPRIDKEAGAVELADMGPLTNQKEAGGSSNQVAPHSVHTSTQNLLALAQAQSDRYVRRADL